MPMLEEEKQQPAVGKTEVQGKTEKADHGPLST